MLIKLGNQDTKLSRCLVGFPINVRLAIDGARIVSVRNRVGLAQLVLAFEKLLNRVLPEVGSGFGKDSMLYLRVSLRASAKPHDLGDDRNLTFSPDLLVNDDRAILCFD